jgi:hypothetical protein
VHLKDQQEEDSGEGLAGNDPAGLRYFLLGHMDRKGPSTEVQCPNWGIHSFIYVFIFGSIGD